jgi:hypothetical protein
LTFTGVGKISVAYWNAINLYESNREVAMYNLKKYIFTLIGFATCTASIALADPASLTADSCLKGSVLGSTPSLLAPAPMILVKTLEGRSVNPYPGKPVCEDGYLPVASTGTSVQPEWMCVPDFAVFRIRKS